MRRKEGVMSRLMYLFNTHSLWGFIRILSQKVQRRVLYHFLLGPKGTLKNVRGCFIKNIDKALDGGLSIDRVRGKKILEIGCGRGRDFLKYFEDIDEIKLVGIDLKKRKELDDIKNFEFICADAENIPFPDDYFDIGVSIGVLEHIAPVEKLARVLSECDRVCKSFVHIVPSVSTLWEPHTGVYRWQLNEPSRKVEYEAPLYILTEETWLGFEALKGAKTFRFDTVPLVCTALAIYRNSIELE